MKNTIPILILLLLSNYCFAEPGQINKSAVVMSVIANSATRNGIWLKSVCDDYKSWNKTPGTLWLGIDSKKENLGAGLCTGFISGVIESNSNECIKKTALNPDGVIDYLDKHPEFNGKAATALVIEAYLEKCK